MARDEKPAPVTPSLTDHVAANIRNKLVSGELVPGQQLSETSLSESLQISRNTLRETFRMLTHEGLLVHVPNRGVFVATPSLAAIIDIYRVRRIIECQAIVLAPPRHPASQRMRAAVESAITSQAAADWLSVGTANMEFHSAVVALADSERLDRLYRNISAELRLAFGMLDDPEFLHEPYIGLNQDILELFEAGQAEAAAKALDDYLVQSERTVLAAYARYAAAAV
ncbi:GntR family transcriptional regulator [Lysinibacter cavernae]|uniref:DNA-binding GntR family transcriptional regulator n=1 Tax=Lysinibacter cavernae TaxID=1640652 RepID=A0A7X5TTS2_9MICO|nr:GntR family transcriptional regulator [Lysinibacter cavernae]NIH54921.1 DNA-binding GntR family transcriptional regulator [Lysinibacter cavernae]